MTVGMIPGSLAASARLSFNRDSGSLAVTLSLPRDTKTQFSVPMNLMPFGEVAAHDHADAVGVQRQPATNSAAYRNSADERSLASRRTISRTDVACGGATMNASRCRVHRRKSSGIRVVKGTRRREPVVKAARARYRSVSFRCFDG